MKKSILLSLFVLFFFSHISATNSLAKNEDLGNGFSLEGALEMFKQSKSLEDFESKLNSEDNHVNNLDLNNDEEIDYIRVFDSMEDDVHAIVLQIVMGKDESQDVAVIQVEKISRKKAVLQIIGDELLYGEDMIIEPFDVEGKEVGVPGPSCEFSLDVVVVNVWFWPSVKFIYEPNYIVYHSPYYWNHYPRRWRPWRPLSLPVHVKHRSHYGHHHRVVQIRRVPKARKIYSPKRRTSIKVKQSTTIRKNKMGRKTKVKTTTIKTKNHKLTKKTKVTKKGNKRVKKTKIKHKRKR